MARQFDTWVDHCTDVATVRDDHFPAVLELIWQPLPQREPAQWHTPIMDRSAIEDAEASATLHSNLSLLAVPDLATPIDAFNAYVIRSFQMQCS